MEVVISTPNEADQKFPISVGRNCEGIGAQNSLGSIFLAAIGAHEYYSPEMWRAALTELVATASLVFSLTSSIISCLESGEIEPKLLVPFTVFIILFLFLMVTIPLSGGHMSLVLTFIAALKGDKILARASVYVLMQCVGAILGFITIKTVMDKNAVKNFSLGGCNIIGNEATVGVGTQTALVVEFACTFVFLLIGVTVAFDKKRCEDLGMTIVCAVVAGAMALAVYVSTTITGRAGYSGAGLNPAKCLGPALLQGGVLWDGHWIFWVGPILACSVYYGFALKLPKEG